MNLYKIKFERFENFSFVIAKNHTEAIDKAIKDRIKNVERNYEYCAFEVEFLEVIAISRDSHYGYDEYKENFAILCIEDEKDNNEPA